MIQSRRSRNLTRRVKRHPKIFVTDPGLAEVDARCSERLDQLTV
jgi:hypothetical protein